MILAGEQKTFLILLTDISEFLTEISEF